MTSLISCTCHSLSSSELQECENSLCWSRSVNSLMSADVSHVYYTHQTATWRHASQKKVWMDLVKKHWCTNTAASCLFVFLKRNDWPQLEFLCLMKLSDHDIWILWNPVLNNVLYIDWLIWDRFYTAKTSQISKTFLK